jgi:ribosomal subunit interface protein
VEIVVKGRHCEISDRFRELIDEKLSKLEKFDHRIILSDVEVTQEHNPRLANNAVRVEITLRTRGPVMRSEASAADKLTALDKAMSKLEARMRRAAERRRAHRDGHRRRVGVLTSADALDAAAGESQASGLSTDGSAAGRSRGAPRGSDAARTGTADNSAEHDDPISLERFGDLTVIGDGPVVVREKEHQARPMSIDQALYEMELVGHDFFLFVDETDLRPAVVYKRRGYTYGVIRLAAPEEYRRAGGA